MFDIGWTEMTVIVILAIIVIGPKDLPKVLRALGRWLRRARVIARDFQTSLDEVMHETELDDLKRQVESAARFDPKREAEKMIDPGAEMTQALGRDTAEGGSGPAAKPASGAAGEPDPDLRAEMDRLGGGSGPDLREELNAPKPGAKGGTAKGGTAKGPAGE